MKTLADCCPPKAGLSTADNERFLRVFWEVAYLKIKFNGTCRDDLRKLKSNEKWIPMARVGALDVGMEIMSMF